MTDKEIEYHIVKPYTMNGGGMRYIGQTKVPTICAMYHNVYGSFPEKPYLMELEYIKIDRKLNVKNNQTKASSLLISGGVTTATQIGCTFHCEDAAPNMPSSSVNDTKPNRLP